ncbi:hypothetical protein ACHAWF_001185 [Thalassiosira exigua]
MQTMTILFASACLIRRRGARAFLAAPPPRGELPRGRLRPSATPLALAPADDGVRSLLPGRRPRGLHSRAPANADPGPRERSGGGGDGDATNPAWTYVPYRPPPKRKPRPPAGGGRGVVGGVRGFATSDAEEWTVPRVVPIPEDKIQVSFARSSGAGGQNVNKVETKVELRFHLDSATWIPAEVRERLKSNESNRINAEGILVVTSQEHRTQAKNRQEATKKLEDIIKSSWPRPKARKMRKGLTKKGKEARREQKKRNSAKKESRKRVNF